MISQLEVHPRNWNQRAAGMRRGGGCYECDSIVRSGWVVGESGSICGGGGGSSDVAGGQQ